MPLDADMKRVVTEQSLGFVATVCPDGTPNLSPKETLAVWDDEHLVFLDLRSPRTMRNIASNPAMEVNVVDPILRKGTAGRPRSSPTAQSSSACSPSTTARPARPGTACVAR